MGLERKKKQREPDCKVMLNIFKSDQRVSSELLHLKSDASGLDRTSSEIGIVISEQMFVTSIFVIQRLREKNEITRLVIRLRNTKFSLVESYLGSRHMYI